MTKKNKSCRWLKKMILAEIPHFTSFRYRNDKDISYFGGLGEKKGRRSRPFFSPNPSFRLP